MNYLGHIQFIGFTQGQTLINFLYFYDFLVRQLFIAEIIISYFILAGMHLTCFVKLFLWLQNPPVSNDTA